MTNWIILFVAGALEVAWAVGLKYTDGFSRPVPSLVYVSMILSVILLGISMKALPLGTAYAVWTGIGTVGTAIFGMCLLGEPRTPLRLALLFVVFMGVTGLYLTESPT